MPEADKVITEQLTVKGLTKTVKTGAIAARSYVGTGLVMSAALGILLGCLIFMFQTPVLLLCGATENVLPYAQRYLGYRPYAR